MIIIRKPHLGRRTASYLCRGGKYLITREVQSCIHETRWGVKNTVSWSKNWGHPRILSSWKQIFRTGRRCFSSFVVALWSILRTHHTWRCFYCCSGEKRSGFVLRCATKQGIWGVNNIKCNSFDHRWRTCCCVSLCDRWLWGIFESAWFSRWFHWRGNVHLVYRVYLRHERQSVTCFLTFNSSSWFF